MVDTATYKQIHPAAAGTTAPRPYRNDLEEFMAQDDPNLGDGFYMCLPTHLYGFNMQKKEWSMSHGSHRLG